MALVMRSPWSTVTCPEWHFRDQADHGGRPAPLHLRIGRDVAGAAEFGGAVLSLVARGATELQQWMGRRRADEGIEPRMRAPRIERVVRRILDALQLRDAILGV